MMVRLTNHQELRHSTGRRDTRGTVRSEFAAPSITADAMSVIPDPAVRLGVEFSVALDVLHHHGWTDSDIWRAVTTNGADADSRTLLGAAFARAVVELAVQVDAAEPGQIVGVGDWASAYWSGDGPTELGAMCEREIPGLMVSF